MKNRVRKYIKDNNMILKGDHIIVGVSGGADSVCLLHILKELKDEYSMRLTVAHINHGIRKGAKEDARYVESICMNWGISYKEHKCNIQEIAQREKCSEEVAGRNQRYGFFEKLREEYNADKIAVAHTMNDQAETMLMRLIRGSGVTGLGGIMPKRDSIIRPLLLCSREEVENYCRENSLDFRDDITNKMDIYTRNKIRLKVLPMLRDEFNPQVIETVAQAANQLQETEDYLHIETQKAYKKIVEEYKKGYSINIDKFLQLHKVIQGRLIRMVIEKQAGSLKDISYQNITDVLGLGYKQSGRKIHIGSSLIAIREHEYIRIMNNEKPRSFSHTLQLGVNKFVECNKKIGLTIADDGKIKQSYENAYTKNIDYDKISGNLQIRNRRAGDRILLRNGSKKLKDFFIDEKIPRTSRDEVVLIADDKNVIWIVGYRLSEFYYITDRTKRVLQIQITDL